MNEIQAKGQLTGRLYVDVATSNQSANHNADRILAHWVEESASIGLFLADNTYINVLWEDWDRIDSVVREMLALRDKAANNA